MGFDRDFGDTLTPHHHEHRHQHQDGKPQEPPRQDEVVIGDAGNETRATTRARYSLAFNTARWR